MDTNANNTADTLNSARAVRAIAILRAGGYVEWSRKCIGPTVRICGEKKVWDFKNKQYVWESTFRDANGQRVAGIGRTTLDALRAAGLMVRDANDHGREVFATEIGGGN
jgi:hypothetical protein